MDLGDFVPQETVMRFSIEGRPYEVRYSEARVDEVLQLMLQAQSQQEPKELIAARRQFVTEFLGKNLSIGDQAQFAEDLKLVPYSSMRGGLDIYALYAATQARVKKNDLGEAEVQTTEQRGFLARLRSWLKPAKAD